MLGFLQQTEADLQHMDYVFGDPKYIEIHLKKLQVRSLYSDYDHFMIFLNFVYSTQYSLTLGYH